MKKLLLVFSLSILLIGFIFNPSISLADGGLNMGVIDLNNIDKYLCGLIIMVLLGSLNTFKLLV